MLFQYLPPEERKGINKYKSGDWVYFDDRPSEESQKKLIENAQKYGSKLKQCAYCGRFIPKYGRKYCSWRCEYDAYMMRRKQRHEQRLMKVCEICGQHFKAKRVDAKYCSDACKQKAYRNMHVTNNRSDNVVQTNNGNNGRSGI